MSTTNGDMSPEEVEKTTDILGTSPKMSVGDWFFTAIVVLGTIFWALYGLYVKFWPQR